MQTRVGILTLYYNHATIQTDGRSANRLKINACDEEPLYDSVASDDDYATAEELVSNYFIV